MKKFLSLMLAAALCVPVGVVAACTPAKEPVAKTLDLMTGWEKNKDEESQYTVKNADSKLTISYEKTGSDWQYLKHAMAVYDVEDLKLMKTVVMEGVYSECSNANNEVTLKFEYSDKTTPSQEVKFWMDMTTSKTYEWDVSEFKLDKVLRMLIFLDGASQQGKGKVEISKFHLTEEAMNPANKMEKPTVTIDPVAKTTNEITAANAKVGNWYGAKDDRNRDVYTIATSGTDTNVTKKINNGTTYWSPVSADVKGAELKKLKSFTVKVKGDAVKFKVEGSDGFLAPKELTLDATKEEVITVAINNPTGLDENKVYTVKLLFAFFSSASEPKFTIKSAEFTKTPVEVVNEIKDDDLVVNKGWYDNDGGIYSIVNKDGAYEVSYNKPQSSEYSYIYAKVKGEALNNMKQLKLVLKGVNNTRVLVKPFNKFEKWVDLNGEEQEVVVDIPADVSAELDVAKEHQVLLFPEGGKAADAVGTEVKGTLIIKSCEFVKGDGTSAVSNVNEITAANLKVTKGWKDAGDGVYTITEANGVFTVAYAKTEQEYANFQAKLSGAELKNVKKIKFVVQGTAGKTAIFKPFNNGTVEKTVTFTGEEQTIEIDVSAVVADENFNTTNVIVIMAEGGSKNVSGSFTIKSCEFVK